MSDSTFDAPVWHNGKALRKGYTTGSCATAAAKVAALMVLRQHLIHQVSIVTPSGVTLCLNVVSPHIEGQQAIAAIRKDGGDDVDATHGMLIFARVTLNDSGEITLGRRRRRDRDAQRNWPAPRQRGDQPHTASHH